MKWLSSVGDGTPNRILITVNTVAIVAKAKRGGRKAASWRTAKAKVELPEGQRNRKARNDLDLPPGRKTL